MGYIGLYLVCMTIFFQGLRAAQERGHPITVSVLYNYVGALAATLIIARGGAFVGLSDMMIFLAILEGVFFVTGLLLTLASYREAGVGITFAVVWLSVAAPVLVAFFAWGEALSAYQWIGLALLPAALVFLRPRTTQAGHPFSAKAILVLFLAFAVTCGVNIIFKAANYYLDASQEGAFRAVLFASALATAALIVGLLRVPQRKGAMLLGVALGVPNGLAAMFLLLGQHGIPAAIVFPVAGCGLILLQIAFGRALWKESTSPRQWIGVALALGVIVLVNLSG